MITLGEVSPVLNKNIHCGWYLLEEPRQGASYKRTINVFMEKKNKHHTIISKYSSLTTSLE